jgi:hypothetical protein
MCSNTDGGDDLKMKGRGQRPANGHPRELNLLLPEACAAGDKKNDLTLDFVYHVRNNGWLY